MSVTGCQQKAKWGTRLEGNDIKLRGQGGELKKNVGGGGEAWFKPGNFWTVEEEGGLGKEKSNTLVKQRGRLFGRREFGGQPGGKQGSSGTL